MIIGREGQAFRNTNAMAVHARPVISTIIRRESHWQSRVLRNDRHGACKVRRIRSLSGQLAQLRALTRGSDGTIEPVTFSLVISEAYWRTRGDSNSR